MRDRLRRLFPPSGPAYELFDCSAFLLLLGFLGYVFFRPSTSQTEALAAPLRFITEVELGYLMMIASASGIVVAYLSRWVTAPVLLWAGYVAPITMTLALSSNYLIGVIATDASGRTVISALLYGWIARRLLAEQPPREVTEVDE